MGEMTRRRNVQLHLGSTYYNHSVYITFLMLLYQNNKVQYDTIQYNIIQYTSSHRQEEAQVRNCCDETTRLQYP